MTSQQWLKDSAARPAATKCGACERARRLARAMRHVVMASLCPLTSLGKSLGSANRATEVCVWSGYSATIRTP